MKIKTKSEELAGKEDEVKDSEEQAGSFMAVLKFLSANYAKLKMSATYQAGIYSEDGNLDRPNEQAPLADSKVCSKHTVH